MSDEKYIKLRQTLKGLPGIRARDNFENKLFQRVRIVDNDTLARQLSEKYSPAQRSRFFNLFRPSLAPAFGLAAALIAAIFVIFYVLTPSGDAPEGDTAANQQSGSFLKDQDIAKIEEKSKEIQSLPEARDVTTPKESNATFPEVSSDARTSRSFTPPPVRTSEKIEEQLTIPEKIDVKTADERNVIEKKEADVKIDAGQDIQVEPKRKEETIRDNETKVSKETFPFNKVSALPRDSVKDTTKISRSRRVIEDIEEKIEETIDQK